MPRRSPAVKPHERAAAIARLRAIPKRDRSASDNTALESLLSADHHYRYRLSRKVAQAAHPNSRYWREVAQQAAMQALRIASHGGGE
jgi:hypothetical protein